MNENEHAAEQLPAHLDKLGDLLDKGWCQGLYAQNESGLQVSYISDEAVCFCIVGGIDKVAHKLEKAFRHLMGAALADSLTLGLMNGLPNSTINKTPSVREGELTDWNDKADRTKEQVVKLCKDTAQRLRAS